MASKKHRDKHRSGSTAGKPPSKTEAPVAAVKAQPATRAPLPAKKSAKKPHERTWLEIAVVQIAHWVGSLQAAVILLFLFVVVMAVGTMMESWYEAKVAGDLVYKTWWFQLLLFLLGANIFFAAAKKWPWKKHQIGFLITHVGLITMVIGGLLNSWGGTDATMPLVDTDERQVQEGHGITQVSEGVIDRDNPTIKVVWNGKDYERSFHPGSLTWYADEYTDARRDSVLVWFLDWLAHPLPRSWQMSMGDARLEVLNYYPTARHEPYSPAEPGNPHTFPAFKVSVGVRGMSEPPRWMALDLENHGDSLRQLLGPAMLEILGYCPAELLEEFLNPAANPGKEGQLVLHIDGQKFRFAVAEQRGFSAEPLENKEQWKRLGKTLRITGYAPRGGRRDRDNPKDSVASDPEVDFELVTGSKTEKYQVLGRVPGLAFPADKTTGRGRFHVWYHLPDYRYGADGLRGLLQFVQGDDEKLYYRSFNTKGFETSGQVKGEQQPHDIWGGMQGRFEISQYLPHAVVKGRFVPEDHRPGLTRSDLLAVVRCRVTVGKESEEFWLAQNRRFPKEVRVGRERFQVSFTPGQAQKLGFQLKLISAKRLNHPGTNTPAEYTSVVELTDKSKGIEGERRVITMNQPLEHGGIFIPPLNTTIGGYKVYQTDMDTLKQDDEGPPERDSTGRVVTYSAFTVGRDPGLWFKYIGSSMLALGVACMFYMKAYFFKPRGKRTETASPGANGEAPPAVAGA